VLKEIFKAVETISEPGAIVDLPLRWKRERYPDA
jgi:hypothetical protein